MNATSPKANPHQVALVTGAADRIGAAIAERLAADGWSVLVHYRSSSDKAKATVARIRAAGGKAAPVKADLASRRQRAGLIGKAARPFGPLTLLVNNASLFERDSVTDLDEALWDAHFAVHAEAPAFLARDLAAQLPDGAEGNVVNMVDARVLHSSPGHFSYTLSKSALLAMTRTLAQSLSPRIRVNAIAPGMTVRPPRQSEESWKAAKGRLPLQRGTSPGEVADTLLFILASRAMTGQVIALDGGEHIEWPERRGPTPRRGRKKQ